jgi:hypothetical protein
MSFQGQDFTPAMKQLVINLKLHFDEERKHHRAVSTRNPTLRTAQGLGIGEITVKRIMAEYRQQGHTLGCRNFSYFISAFRYPKASVKKGWHFLRQSRTMWQSPLTCGWIGHAQSVPPAA